MTQCSGCHKYCKIEDGYRTCQNCVQRTGKIHLENKSEVRNCQAKMSNDRSCQNQCLTESDFCGKHQKYAKLVQSDLVKCSKESCYNPVDDPSLYKKCQKCRQTSTIRDRQLRQEHLESISKDERTDVSICHNSKCRNEFQPFETKLGQSSTKCPKCYQQQQVIEHHRGKRLRNWRQELLNNPDRAKKREERIQNQKSTNPERFVQYWVNYRLKQRELLGEEGYRKRVRDRMTKYREEHPEIIKSIQDRFYNENIERRIYVYRYTAYLKGVEWLLSDLETQLLFLSPCFYCGFQDSKRLSGIDKIVCEGNYSPENTDGWGCV